MYQAYQQPPPHSRYSTPAHHHSTSQHQSYRPSQDHGYYQQRPPGPPGPPPGGDPTLWKYFTSVDKDHSGAISVLELQQALVNGDWSKFDLDTVKMLMSMFDTDRSGTIGFSEFSGLWKYIADWQNVFRHFDSDRSGSIEGKELSEALRSFGYNLSPTLLTLIEHKYSSDAISQYGPPPGITFDRFVRACVSVKTVTEAFQRADNDRDGWVHMNYEQFMQIVLSAP